MPERPSLNEQYYMQVSESIRSVYELVTRIDERVKNITTKQQSIENKISEQTERLNKITSRLDVLESQELNTRQKDSESNFNKTINDLKMEVQRISQITTGQENRWKGIFTVISQITITIAAVVVAAYIIYHMGIQ